jgi:hypothetical protein
MAPSKKFDCAIITWFDPPRYKNITFSASNFPIFIIAALMRWP